MSSDAREVSVELLRTLTPLEGMKRENLHALAKKVTVKQMTAGRVLFKEGDSDKRTIWIIRGMVELSENGRTVGMIEGGSADARAPLNQAMPRKITARAVEDVDYLGIDADLLDVMITWDQTGNYEVGELQAQFGGNNEDSDWMTTLLQTKAFHRIPPANLQAIFMRMNRTPYRAGEVVIKQGDEGDYFYAIVQGKCLVTRESPLNQKGIKLAELAVGETFGEEALIAEAKRNATVTMLTDGDDNRSSCVRRRDAQAGDRDDERPKQPDRDGPARGHRTDDEQRGTQTWRERPHRAESYRVIPVSLPNPQS